MAAIEEALARTARGEREAVGDLDRLFHTIAGTAGTFGFDRLSEIAAEAEVICDGVACPEEAAASCAVLLDSLREAASAAPAPLATLGLVAAPPAWAEGVARILCIDDDADQAAYLCSILRHSGYDVESVQAAARFDGAVETFRPDLILLDINLEDGNGLDLARRVRENELVAALPIVFVTGRRSIESRIDGMRAGGDDYLVKPVQSDLLLATVASRLERAQAVKTLVDRDELTRLSNQGAFQRRMQLAVDERAKRDTQFCLVMLDIDHFKKVNDRYGHLIGDRVLSSFARFLRAGVRDEDAVGRCGGEEFGIVLARMSPADAQGVTQRLLERFGAMEHAARRGARFFVTFSAGVAQLLSGDTVDSWKQRADDALYAAKRAGRARVAAA
jgi:diguanylate cyclase (GGDEF)-like protein